MTNAEAISLLVWEISEGARFALRIGDPNREPEDGEDTALARMESMREQLSGILDSVTDLRLQLEVAP